MKMFLYCASLSLGLLLAACDPKPVTPPDSPSTDNPDTAAVVRRVATFITTADNTMRFTAVGRDFAEGLNMSPEQTLTLNPHLRYQTFDGFGAAITGATAYNLKQMPADRREKLLRETFSVKDGMGYSYVRVPIGGSDFNAHSNYDYTCCDVEGIDHFALTSDELDYIIPMLREILTINPDLKVMGTPWSCPRWM
ncbi:MAG: glucosylceramidase, partial [Paludibacteraceae bacterium]|nr:glucosylceramidase [Paludibacteraceae bacterium]